MHAKPLNSRRMKAKLGRKACSGYPRVTGVLGQHGEGLRYAKQEPWRAEAY